MEIGLKEKRFNKGSEVKSAVYAHFKDKTSNYYYVGLEKLFYRYNKCILKQEDYIEE
jgi:hypothetical protein